MRCTGLNLYPGFESRPLRHFWRRRRTLEPAGLMPRLAPNFQVGEKKRLRRVNRSTPRTVVSALAAMLLSPGCALQGARSIEELRGRLDALRAKWSVPGMSAAMARDGKVVWERGFGLSDVEAGRPAAPDTLYHLCSLT